MIVGTDQSDGRDTYMEITQTGQIGRGEGLELDVIELDFGHAHCSVDTQMLLN